MKIIITLFLLISISLSVELKEIYKGTFYWEGASTNKQTVELNIIEEKINKNIIEAIGKGSYTEIGETTTVDIKIYIDKDLGTFKMTETNPIPYNKEFVLNGMYEGTVSKDLTRINAVWTSSSDKDKGTLELKSAN